MSTGNGNSKHVEHRRGFKTRDDPIEDACEFSLTPTAMISGTGFSGVLVLTYA